MRYGGSAIKIVVDASFVAHALLPNQRDMEAEAAFETLGVHEVVCADSFLAEFASLLRKSVTRRDMPLTEAEKILSVVQAVTVARVGTSRALLDRAWEIATLLGQSDIFDSPGYAVAEAEGAEFWTSDRRFANAANGRLPGIRLVG